MMEDPEEHPECSCPAANHHCMWGSAMSLQDSGQDADAEQSRVFQVMCAQLPTLGCYERGHCGYAVVP